MVLNLYSEDVDHLFNQAVAAGATVTMPLANQFWGDRYGQITDPFGHRWALGQMCIRDSGNIDAGCDEVRDGISYGQPDNGRCQRGADYRRCWT